MTSHTANNYAHTQNGRLQSTVGCNPVAIPEDTRKSEPTNQKVSLKFYFDMIFIPD